MDNTMKPKTFKAKPWMIAGIHQLAHQEDVSDGEWLRRIILDALIKRGYTPEQYFNNTDH